MELTKYIENQLSLDRHKMNLLQIYNRRAKNKTMEKSVVFLFIQ